MPTFREPNAWWHHPVIQSGLEAGLIFVISLLTTWACILYWQKIGGGGKWLIAAKLRGETKKTGPVTHEPLEIPTFTYGPNLLEEVVRRAHEQDELLPPTTCEDHC